MKPGWRKFSYTGSGSDNCVEVGGAVRLIVVRDTKNPSGPTLHFISAVWRRS